MLIPRPETEHVMEVALERLGARGIKIHMDTGAPRETLRVADVGTGSGCLAVALARELPHAEVFRDGYFRGRRSKWRAAMLRAMASPSAFISCNAISSMALRISILAAQGHGMPCPLQQMTQNSSI